MIPIGADMLRVEVVLKGHIDPKWEESFEGLKLVTKDENVSSFVGEVPDMTALYGVLGKLRDLGLTLVSVRTSEEHGDRSE